MEKVYLLTYKSVHEGVNGILNRIIRTMDKTIYSHSELSIGNPLEQAVPCYSSSGVDHGVRMKVMKISPDKWDVIELPWVNAEDIRQFYSKTDESGYDYLGLVRFLLPWMLREHPVHYFCTEWAAAAVGLGGAWRYTPAQFHELCRYVGGIEVSS